MLIVILSFFFLEKDNNESKMLRKSTLLLLSDNFWQRRIVYPFSQFSTKNSLIFENSNTKGNFCQWRIRDALSGVSASLLKEDSTCLQTNHNIQFPIQTVTNKIKEAHEIFALSKTIEALRPPLPLFILNFIKEKKFRDSSKHSRILILKSNGTIWMH